LQCEAIYPFSPFSFWEFDMLDNEWGNNRLTRVKILNRFDEVRKTALAYAEKSMFANHSDASSAALNVALWATTEMSRFIETE
jgi:hypothetical protein